MSSTKNPDHEAENPAPMPHKPKMAPHADAPAGLEQDSHGNVIPLAQRTKDDQEKAKSGNKDA